MAVYVYIVYVRNAIDPEGSSYRWQKTFNALESKTADRTSVKHVKGNSP